MKARPMEGNSLFNTATGVFNITTTLFSLVVMYFIYVFSEEKILAGVAANAATRGWEILNFVSKWYLYIVVGIFALFAIIAIVVLLFSLIMWLGYFARR